MKKPRVKTTVKVRGKTLEGGYFIARSEEFEETTPKGFIRHRVMVTLHIPSLQIVAAVLTGSQEFHKVKAKAK